MGKEEGAGGNGKGGRGEWRAGKRLREGNEPRVENRGGRRPGGGGQEEEPGVLWRRSQAAFRQS